MYRGQRELEERVRLLEARLAVVQDALRSAPSDAHVPRTQRLDLEVEQKGLRSERRALRRAQGQERKAQRKEAWKQRLEDAKSGSGEDGDERSRPFWVVAFWFVVFFAIGIGFQGNVTFDVTEVPTVRTTVIVISLLVLLLGGVATIVLFGLPFNA